MKTSDVPTHDIAVKKNRFGRRPYPALIIAAWSLFPLLSKKWSLFPIFSTKWSAMIQLLKAEEIPISYFILIGLHPFGVVDIVGRHFSLTIETVLCISVYSIFCDWYE